MAVQQELWGSETSKAIENFPVSGRARAHPGGPLAGAHQGRGGAGERRARAARRRGRRARRAGRRRGRGGPARRPVPDRRLPDRLRHVLEHERQRGDREPRRRGRPRERPREHGAVVERRVPLGRSPRRRGHRPPRAAARAQRALELARPQGGRVRRRRQGRPHAHDGRGARDARAGVRRLRGPDPARTRPRARLPRARVPDPARRDGHGHRAEHAPGVRVEGARAARAR